jgi:hypothetical protein
MELFAVPLGPEIWQQYTGFFKYREGGRLSVPPAPRAGAWIVTQRGQLVAGYCIYSTDASFLFAEGLATDPAAPLRLRHKAVEHVILVVNAFAATTGKHIVATPRVRGVAKVLARYGFQMQPGVIMTSGPSLRIGDVK